MDLIEKEAILSPVQVTPPPLSHYRNDAHCVVVAGYFHSGTEPTAAAPDRRQLHIQESQGAPSLFTVTDQSLIGFIAQDLTDDIVLGESRVRGALADLDGISQSSVAQNQAKINKAAKAQEKAAQRRQQQHRMHDYDDDEDDDEEEDETEEDAKALEEKETERWFNIRKAQLACSQEHEAFYKELELSADGFSTVAGFFGRSIINA